MSLVLAAEIAAGILIGPWILGYFVWGLRRILHGPDVIEPVNEAFVDAYELRAAREGWAHRFLVAFDICVNVLFRGQPDETISGRAYRASLENKLWGRVMNYWLGLLESQHGIKAVVGDYTRAKSRIAINSKILGIQ